jgi:phosphoribosylformylglycinamidine (FGAM) synthase-like amidotransferase family enzyme
MPSTVFLVLAALWSSFEMISSNSFRPVLVLLALILSRSLDAQESGSQRIRVAVFQGPGVSSTVSELIRDLQRSPALVVDRIDAEAIRAGSLESEVDVVVFPGGSGGGQGKALASEGREAVRRFIDRGGCYVGVCAGAYLASADYSWSLHLLDARVLDRKHWARGFGPVRLTLRQEAQEAFAVDSDHPQVYYHQGPLLAPAQRDDLEDYRELATFATEVRKEKVPNGVMPGTTAMAAGRFGKGFVLAISPHPERTEGLDDVLPAMVQAIWLRRSRSLCRR